jgi:cytochrome P450
MSLLGTRSELLPAAVDELIRYDAPVQMVTRWAYADVRYGGDLLRRGDKVTLVLGAANRDPRRFPNPDTIDVHRTGSKHCGFGMGIHYCLGSALGRAEAEVALGVLLTVLPRFHLGDEPIQFAPDTVFHRPERLLLRR